ncbi:MAG: AbrB/MazE/SpoVT family DNA-binding domain-containing protein [Candidatus Woesearchaeota archaeon]
MPISKIKPWGNSIGLIVPKETVKKLNLKPGEEVAFTIEKKGNVLKELYGALKFKKSTKQLLKESRELESKWI